MAAALPQGFTAGEADSKTAEMEEQIAQMIDQILTPEAKDRLARVSIVRKEQAQKLKLKLIDMARTGKLTERVTEAKLCSLLEETQSSTQTKV